MDSSGSATLQSRLRVYRGAPSAASRFTDHRAGAGNGSHPRPADETKRDQAMHFGTIDKKDFLILSFALFYFYIVIAAAFGWPMVSKQQFFSSEALARVGVLLCAGGLLLFLLSLVSFGRGFRVGIDADHPDKLITTGVFALSRSPIYVASWIILLGQFLVSPNWLLLVYLGAATWLFQRQVLREEAYLIQHYGRAYAVYCARVRRCV